MVTEGDSLGRAANNEQDAGGSAPSISRYASRKAGASRSHRGYAQHPEHFDFIRFLWQADEHVQHELDRARANQVISAEATNKAGSNPSSAIPTALGARTAGHAHLSSRTEALRQVRVSLIQHLAHSETASFTPPQSHAIVDGAQSSLAAADPGLAGPDPAVARAADRLAQATEQAALSAQARRPLNSTTATQAEHAAEFCKQLPPAELRTLQQAIRIALLVSAERAANASDSSPPSAEVAQLNQALLHLLTTHESMPPPEQTRQVRALKRLVHQLRVANQLPVALTDGGPTTSAALNQPGQPALAAQLGADHE